MVKHYQSLALNKTTQRILQAILFSLSNSCHFRGSQSQRETRLMYFVTYCAHRLNLATFTTVNTYLYRLGTGRLGLVSLSHIRIGINRD